MVLGLSAKNRKEPSVHVDYLIYVQEIKPWPPSQSLRSLRSVLIQWENGDRNTGSTKTIVPSLGSVVGEGKIEFNESFRLPVTLIREMNAKNKDADTFQKNCLEFNLYEPRRDKTTLLATAIVDLAEYGIVKETLNVNVPMNSKRSFRNTSQPVLFAKIQPVDKSISRTSSSLREGFLKEAASDKNGGESVSALMNEEYAEEAETASFTDDDVSSHSFVIVSSSATESNKGLPSQNEENGPVMLSHSTGLKKENALGSKLQLGKSNMKSQIIPHENGKTSSCSSSIDLSPELGSPLNGHASAPDSPISSSFISKNVVAHSVHSPALSFTNRIAEEEASVCMRGNGSEELTQGVPEKLYNGKSAINGDSKQHSEEFASNNFPAKISYPDSGDSQVNGEGGGKTLRIGKNSQEDATNSDDDCNGFVEDIQRMEQEDNEPEREGFEDRRNSTGNEPSNFYSRDANRNQVLFGSDALSSSSENLGNFILKGNISRSDNLKHVKSVRSSSDAARSNGLVTNNHHNEVKENGVFGDANSTSGNFRTNERKDTKVYPNNSRSALVDSKIHLLENKIKMLEAELREAAAIEAALYSVVAEHGSSMSKVHAPARRLSRLYLHACKESSLSRKASAARTGVSGLILAAKACGNDVSRLTFWLSNSVVLRAIISQANRGTELQPEGKNSGRRGNIKISSPLKWKEPSPSKKENRNGKHGSVGEWEEPHAFSSALEKVEAWIFSRIVESIWWQTLTPHMHAASAKAIDKGIGSGSRKNYGSTSISGDEDQVNFSLDHWKKAFKDACERLCPVRAGGHVCGCLPLLARMIMEQCIARLDVAMFNAILRESTDEIPTDPVSDPISDSKVLPIPACKASFGAGAQLKNAEFERNVKGAYLKIMAEKLVDCFECIHELYKHLQITSINYNLFLLGYQIGNWSRWLSDLFGMDDDDDLLENENNDDENEERQDTSFKLFHLLNALSDLMMLPKDMLLSRSIRKEVCPAFGTPLIKRVLDNFVPDEFCPDPIPDVVLEALEFEDSLEVGEESVTNVPCIAAPPLYTPPSAAAVSCIIGEIGNQSQLRRSGSSVVRKSYTSDDELDELNSPLSSIFIDGSRSSPASRRSNWTSKENNNQNAVRYELLRDIWMNSE
ncbi:hypothetical protein Ddye_000082 [Dipteronia dyeriana]|uniref:C2 NT-type domain-containing protein n=1 Tax=Dipteronia dyeriana TaxID=168575 RepID=A0AAD9XM96_9ROSI|nr:hypothetical protein Ddye_000082 [Dipteronia dyeriana]